MDAIDKRILRALQRNGRLQNVELAKEVGLSPSPCLRRVRLLEDAGVIDRYVAVIDPAKIGLRFSLFARIWLTTQDAETIDLFISAMEQLPEVVECYIMLGESDALIRVVVADLDGYRKFQSTHLTRRNGIQSVKTDVPSQTVKQSFALPIS
ncbi:DNA-binding Lrp family transcriptional regulator [Nitrospirillum iridis]|uniref:DNA-binding Lrp family transcriptional regulator n=1 Tax=Nitrospirillum iridis TaxID=765888 RepID=A0A7X0B2I1_9PROT|nr:DNA-binding Lrp family transcriptional regulator [Nitrospirillum iridis]